MASCLFSLTAFNPKSCDVLVEFIENDEGVKPAPLNGLFPELMMKLSPLLSVQDFAQLRAACSQPQALAFQQLLKLPSPKRRLLVKVERKRSAEQWAELAKVNQDKQWNKKSKQKIVYNLLGGKHHFTPTGSVFDGWKEYLLCTSIGCCSPDKKPALYEDLVFRDWPKRIGRST